jgi:hypothetical protein
MFTHIAYCRLLSALFLDILLLGVVWTPLQLFPAQAAEKAKTSVDLSTAIIQVAKQNIPDKDEGR